MSFKTTVGVSIITGDEVVFVEPLATDGELIEKLRVQIEADRVKTLSRIMFPAKSRELTL